jgi:hypothetical protein
MKCLTIAEAEVLCARLLIEKPDPKKYPWMIFKHGGNTRSLVRFGESNHLQKHLSKLIFQSIANTNGYLIWLHDWHDAALYELMMKARLSAGETRSLLDCPVFLFDQSEADLARAIILLVLAFDWGCYLIPLDGRALFNIYNEGVEFWGATEKIHVELKQVIDWKDEDAS